ncbi:MAG: O-antigen ligase family protein [Alphaproteobacteria bacterium]|nr:O-antigen ligase family protein [Alphaproteobacteria bacterium]
MQSFIMAGFALLMLLLLSPRGLAYAPGIAGLLACGGLYFVAHTRPLFNRTAAGAVGGLLLLAALSALWSSQPSDALERTLKVALVLGPGLLLLAAAQTIAMGRALLWPALAVAVVAVLAAVELAFDFPLYRVASGVPAGDFVPPAQINRTMVSLIMFLPLAAYAALRVRGPAVAALIGASILPALFMTESQSSQLAVVIGALCLCLPLRRKIIWVAIAVILAAAIMLTPWIAQWMFGHLTTTLTANNFTGAGGGYAGHRMEIWDAIARVTLERPLYGYGIEAVRYMDSLPLANLYHQGASTLHPHNFALQFWVEFGVIGAVFITALCLLILRTLYTLRDNPATRWLLASFAVTISIAAMGYGIWQGWWLGLLMLQVAFSTLLLRAHQSL